MIPIGMSRRAFLLAGAALAAGIPLGGGRASTEGRVPILRGIPSSGEELPVIGLGTYITFDVGSGPADLSGPAEVLRLFFDIGGKLIDSSPMYGRAEAVVGELLQAMDPRPHVFAATKVWTDGRQGRHRADGDLPAAHGGEGHRPHADPQSARLENAPADAA